LPAHHPSDFRKDGFELRRHRSGAAIARRVSDLLGSPVRETDKAGAEIIFTSRRPHTLSRALMPFFGGRVPA
jgi:hypothetical protein